MLLDVRLKNEAEPSKKCRKRIVQKVKRNK